MPDIVARHYQAPQKQRGTRSKEFLRGRHILTQGLGELERGGRGREESVFRKRKKERKAPFSVYKKSRGGTPRPILERL